MSASFALKRTAARTTSSVAGKTLSVSRRCRKYSASVSSVSPASQPRVKGAKCRPVGPDRRRRGRLFGVRERGRPGGGLCDICPLVHGLTTSCTSFPAPDPPDFAMAGSGIVCDPG